MTKKIKKVEIKKSETPKETKEKKSSNDKPDKLTSAESAKSEKKINKKTILASAIIALVLVVFSVLAAIIFSGKKNTVAIWGLEKPQSLAVKSEIEKISKEQNLALEVQILDGEKSLSSQLMIPAKILAVITTKGYGTETAESKASKNSALPADLTLEMTSSMRAAAKITKNEKGGKDDGKISVIPLLSDNLEIDIATQAFRNSGMSAISTWSDIENFSRIQKRKIEFPLVFAGADGKFFLDLLGGLAEAFDGQDSYKKAKEILKNAAGKRFNAAKLADELAQNPDSPLITSVRTLKNWQKNGILNPNTFALSKKDVNAFVSNNLASGFFMSLSDHRNFGSKISNYSSIYLPSENNAAARCFTSATICAVPLKKSKSVEKLIKTLVSQEGQENLSRATGLAPVLAHCRTPDKQADDVRYWIAATNTPNAGLGNEIFFTPSQYRQLAKELATKVMY
ncbi:MAG: hypothetical protein SOT81_05220 [Treponema sp.]|nr:hypothetical protein [Treponema sp.]